MTHTTNRTTRRANRVLATVGAAALAALSCVVGATPAAAADGGVAWSETKGNALTLLSVTTEDGCPEDAQRVSASLFGKGLPDRGQVVVAPSTFLFATDGPMTLPFSNAFVVYAERNSTELEGRYRLEVRCTDRFGVNSLATFGASMTWATPGGGVRNIDKATFTARNTADVKPGTVAPQADAALPVPDAAPAPDEPAPAPAPEAPASAAAPAPGERPAPAPSTPAAAPVVPEAGTDPGTSAATTDTATDAASGGLEPLPVVLAVTAAALLGLGAWWLLRPDRRTPTP
jgi:hypothetical protein